MSQAPPLWDQGYNFNIWINDFLCNRTQWVIVIPQGTFLAPLLFLIYYITDLPKNILSPIKLCADDHDVFIYRTIESEHDHIILQQDLNKLQEWANAWLMSFNPSKCEMIRNKKNPIVGNYYIQNHLIKVVTHAKYLGVTIDKHLIFNEHICRISYKANSINAFLHT